MKPLYYIDASSLKEANCFRRLFWNNILGLRPKDAPPSDYKQAYGIAFHKFLEGWYQDHDFKSNANKALDFYKPFQAYIPESVYEFRTLSHLAKCMDAYTTCYSAESDLVVPLKDNAGNILAEQTFVYPYESNDMFEIVLSGIIDLYATYAGRLCLVDHKTTAAYEVDKFFTEFDLNIQTMFYVWIDKQLSGREEYLPILVNGIFLKKSTEKAAKLGNFDGVKFQRSQLIEYTPTQMQEFEDFIHSKLIYIIDRLCKGISTEDFDLASCLGRFGMCKYYRICKTPKEYRTDVLTNYYKTTEYNPLTFHEQQLPK
jgi:hypothetical protein